eukprot:m.167394 g.167394  ORF g.167394 m.167394 type:complete len:1287 (+) comp14461_c0_seq2:311-4171(+)
MDVEVDTCPIPDLADVAPKFDSARCDDICNTANVTEKTRDETLKLMKELVLRQCIKPNEFEAATAACIFIAQQRKNDKTEMLESVDHISVSHVVQAANVPFQRFFEVCTAVVEDLDTFKMLTVPRSTLRARLASAQCQFVVGVTLSRKLRLLIRTFCVPLGDEVAEEVDGVAMAQPDFAEPRTPPCAATSPSAQGLHTPPARASPTSPHAANAPITSDVSANANSPTTTATAATPPTVRAVVSGKSDQASEAPASDVVGARMPSSALDALADAATVQSPDKWQATQIKLKAQRDKVMSHMWLTFIVGKNALYSRAICENHPTVLLGLLLCSVHHGLCLCPKALLKPQYKSSFDPDATFIHENGELPESLKLLIDIPTVMEQLEETDLSVAWDCHWFAFARENVELLKYTEAGLPTKTALKSLNTIYERMYILPPNSLIDERVFISDNLDDMGDEASKESPRLISSAYAATHRLSTPARKELIHGTVAASAASTLFASPNIHKRNGTPLVHPSSTQPNKSLYNFLMNEGSAVASHKLCLLLLMPQEPIYANIMAILQDIEVRFVTAHQKIFGKEVQKATERTWDLQLRLFFILLERFLESQKEQMSQETLTRTDLIPALAAFCIEIALSLVQTTWKNPHVSPTSFPWVLNVCGVSPIAFWKIINHAVDKLLVLFPTVVDHIERIEVELVCRYLWQTGSSMLQFPTLPTVVESQAIRPVHPRALPDSSMIPHTSPTKAKPFASPLLPTKRAKPVPSSSSSSASSSSRRSPSKFASPSKRSPSKMRHSSPLPHSPTKKSKGMAPRINLLGTSPEVASSLKQVRPGASAISVAGAASVSASATTSATSTASSSTNHAPTTDGSGQPSSSPAVASTNHSVTASPASFPRPLPHIPSPGSRSAVTAVGTGAMKPFGAHAQHAYPQSVMFVLRKLYIVTFDRFEKLISQCDEQAPSQFEKQLIWTCFEHVVVNMPHLLTNHHTDSILLCCWYGMLKALSAGGPSFKSLVSVYRKTFPTTYGVVRDLVVGDIKRLASLQKLDSDVKPQDSVLPLTGAVLSHVSGNVISFYNLVFVALMRSFMFRLVKAAPTLKEHVQWQQSVHVLLTQAAAPIFSVDTLAQKASDQDGLSPTSGSAAASTAKSQKQPEQQTSPVSDAASTQLQSVSKAADPPATMTVGPPTHSQEISLTPFPTSNSAPHALERQFTYTPRISHPVGRPTNASLFPRVPNPIASPRTALLTAPTNQAPMVPRQSSAANPFGDMEDDMPPPLPFASSKRASAKRTLAISAPDSQSK